MAGLTVRHFTEADVPLRGVVLRDPHFAANVTDWALAESDAEITARQHRIVRTPGYRTLVLTVCRGEPEEVTGFAWINDQDPLQQSCELTLVMLPEFRGVLGSLAMIAVLDFLYGELNVRVVLHRVGGHNTMLHSAARLADTSRVACVDDVWTGGEFRLVHYWTQTAESFYAGPAATAARRERRRAQIMAAAP